MIVFTSNNITYRIAFPAYPVSLFVDHYVVMNGQASYQEERIFPNNKAELFFNLGDSLAGKSNNSLSPFQLKESVISGTRLTYFTFTPGAYFFMAGCRFTLFGLYHLFRIPAYHFRDHNFDTKDIWGNEMEWVREQLLETKSYYELMKALNDWIVTKIEDTALPEVHQWKQVATKFRQVDTPITPLMSKVIGYSHKHSIRLIKEKAGLNPKAIQKVNRLELVLQILAKPGPIDWMNLVCSAGYADQSHLIREFRRFTGYTPAEYVSIKPKTYRLYQQLEEEKEAGR